MVFSIYSRSCATMFHLIPEQFHHPNKKAVLISSHCQLPPSATKLLSVSINLPILDIPSKWSQKICGLLPGFFQLACFQGSLLYSMYQYLLIFMDKLHVLCGLKMWQFCLSTSWETFGFFLLFGCHECSHTSFCVNIFFGVFT